MNSNGESKLLDAYLQDSYERADLEGKGSSSHLTQEMRTS
jgi:hypothetical protein